MSDNKTKKIKLLQLGISLLVGALLAGCGGGGEPLSPDPGPGGFTTEGQAAVAHSNGRIEWGLWSISLDTASMTGNVVPLREGQIHYNILHMLEGWSCMDCVYIDGPLNWSDDGNLLVDIGIRHPYAPDRLDLTGRDVRGIAIFPGTTSFPNHFVRDLNAIEQPLLASRYLINPDGYTTHFNRWTAHEGYELYDYRRGRLTWETEKYIEGNLHPFHYFYTHEYKQLFYPNNSVVRTYEIDIDFQETFTFAYSVDASWSLPHTWPVYDPITGFDISASSLEPFQISITIDDNALTRQGGYADLTLDILDHQGWESISTITFEAPDLFYGVQSIDPATHIMVDGEVTRYDVTINNTTGYAKIEDGGSDLLVVVEDDAMSVVGQDFRAYNIFKLPVKDTFKEWRPREGTFISQPFPGPTPFETHQDVTVIRNPEDQWAFVSGEPMLLFPDDNNEKHIACNRDFDQSYDLAGYPGTPNSWLAPVRRIDATACGGLGVVSDSDVPVDGEYLVKHCTNMHKPIGIYNFSWYTGSLGDPTPYLELAGDVSGGFGNAMGDPIYSIYLFDSATGYAAPAYQSLHRIGSPYSDPMETLRAFVPLANNLSGNAPPYGVSYGHFVAMGVDDDPVGETNPLTVIVYTAENRLNFVDNYSLEIDAYKINFSDPLHFQHIRTYRSALLADSIAWVYPVLQTPRIADIDVLPAATNEIYMGAGEYPERNWVAVLYTYNIHPGWFIEIFDVEAQGPFGVAWEVPIFRIGPYPGHALAMDVDPENFEIYVLHDDHPFGIGASRLTCLEYY